ncbi:MAG: DUF3185 family protein [Gracilimonas sp.]|uniref:DUF3185 family protein n=1 Tax=Gracilimonas sp. TaxID=1974203 RepID=UPI001B0579A7|nr:DUF3185 family protein [Gracilimonas sp.]MBO6585957.1 DUF3185 family protein [Gracilimonas sp.]MBO6616954.1 DUF3185 family protein [Gracilimonas sp.]
MNRIVATALLIAGGLLLYFGYQEYNSFGSELDQAFGGSGSTNAIIMLVVGVVAVILGGARLVKKK